MSKGVEGNSNVGFSPLQYFRFGKIVQDGKMTIEDAARYFNIPTSDLLVYSEMAAAYKCEEKAFLGDYERSNLSFRDFIGQLKKNAPERLKMAQIAKEIDTCVKLIDRTNPSTFYELKSIRDKIDRVIPPKYNLSDDNYIKYYVCACCGATARPDGHELRQYNDIIWLHYPICKDCATAQAHPSLERLFYMYANYALNVEKAYEQLR